MKTEASKYKIHPSARVGGWLNQFDDTVVCKSCNDDSLSEKFYHKSSLGGEECAWPPLNTS